MRRLQTVVFLAVMEGVSCQRGPGLCPEGMRPDRRRDSGGSALWCTGKTAPTRRWIELWGPTERRQSCGYTDGKPDGAFFAWHRGGKLWLEGQYRGGQKEGHWTQWDDEGHRVAEGDYRDGRLVSGAPVGMVATCEQQKP